MIPPEQQLAQAYQLHQAGQFNQAEKVYRQLQPLIPDNPTLWLLSAALAEHNKDYDQALFYIDKAIKLPGSQKNADILQAKGEILRQMKEFGQAKRWFEKALKANPNHLNAYINYILTLITAQTKQDLAKADFQLRKAKKIDPAHPLLLNAEGLIRLEQHEPELAEQAFEKALAIVPQNPEFEGNYILALMALKKYEKALPIIQRNLDLDPGNLKFKFNKAVCLEKKGDISAATSELSLVTYEVLTKYPEISLNFFDLLKRLSLTEKAIALLEEQQQAEGELDSDHKQWLLTFYSSGKRFNAALSLAEDILAHQPSSQDLRLIMDLYIQTCFYHGQQQIIEKIGPAKYPYCASFLHEVTLIHSSDDAIAVLGGFTDKYKNKNKSRSRPITAPTILSHSSPLKLAFLSSDIRTHSVGKFVLPFLRHYDRDKLEITILANHHQQEDPYAIEAEKLTHQTHNIWALNTEDVSKLVAENQPDILMELNGHTALARLELVQARLAPIQIAWLGFPFSTATPSMDYFLVDHMLKPEDQRQFSEKLLTMDGPWISVEYDNLPDIAPLPYQQARRITFGSMTNLYKITPQTIALWSKVLHQVPTASFLLVYPLGESQAIIDNIKTAFAAHQIDPNRIVFLDNRKAKMSHYDCYAHIDIALDTLPLTGGTTTIDAIGMGVPVVTLQGPCLHQRLSHSILSYGNLGYLSAATEAEFIEIAVNLAQNPENIASQRLAMRDNLQKSPLMDSTQFAENLTNCLFSCREA